MHSTETLRLLVELEQRELIYPQETPLAFVDQVMLPAEMKPQLPQDLFRLHAGIGNDEQSIADFDRGFFHQLVFHTVADEFQYRRLVAAFGSKDIGQSAGTEITGQSGQFVNLLTRIAAAAFEDNPLNDTAAFDVVGENLEIAVCRDIGQVDYLHAETEIGFVDSPTAHYFFVCKPGERRGNVDSENPLEYVNHQPLDQRENIVRSDERHLQVDLGMFRLAVGPKVLVAQAARNLEVLVEAGHHQDLFEELR